MENSSQPDRLPFRERGSSGTGTLIGVLGFGAAAIAGATAFSFAPWALIAGGALALMGSGLMVAQNRKEKRNDQHAIRAYHLTEEYHHEPEVVRDQSLLHAIKGPSDLPERQRFIKEHYGVTPQTAEQFRGARLGTTALMGVGVGALVTGAAVMIGGALLGSAALAYGLMLGALGGATAAGLHSARVTHDYGNYLDTMEATERQKASVQKTDSPPPEYDNQRSRPGSYAVDVVASRGQTTTTVSR